MASTLLKAAALAAAADWRYEVVWDDGEAPDMYSALGVVPPIIMVVRTD